MKLLRNPWVAGGLAIVALAVVFYVVAWPRFSRRGQGARGPQPPATAPTGAASVQAPPPVTVPPPEMAIDRAYAQAHFQGWIDAPARDPFLLMGSVAPAATPRAAVEISPVAMMKLKAIWRQTGGTLAAIDKGLYAEGDTIVAGYKVDRIEGDLVWIQGPERRERLDFDKRFIAEPLPPRGTNFIEKLLGPEPADPLRPKL